MFKACEEKKGTRKVLLPHVFVDQLYNAAFLRMKLNLSKNNVSVSVLTSTYDKQPEETICQLLPFPPESVLTHCNTFAPSLPLLEATSSNRPTKRVF